MPSGLEHLQDLLELAIKRDFVLLGCCNRKVRNTKPNRSKQVAARKFRLREQKENHERIVKWTP